MRRAHSLLFSHLAGGAQVNPSVILMAHDRAFPLQYQMFLNKVKESELESLCIQHFVLQNAEHCGDVPLALTQRVDGHNVKGQADRLWPDTDDAHELIEAIYNW